MPFQMLKKISIKRLNPCGYFWSSNDGISVLEGLSKVISDYHYGNVLSN